MTDLDLQRDDLLAELEAAKADLARLRKSEARYRFLFDNVVEGAVVVQDGRMLLANARATDITGYTLDELTSRPFTDFIYPDDRQTVMDRYQKRLEGKPAPVSYPSRTIDKNGRVRWVEIRPVRIEWEGRPATLSLLADVTRQKVVEDMMRAVTLESPIPTAVVDNEGNVLSVNAALVELTGYSAEEVPTAEESINKLIPQDPIRDRVMTNVREALAGRAMDSYELRITPADGMPRTVDVHLSGFEGGTIAQWVDVTERISAEKQLRQAREELEDIVARRTAQLLKANQGLEAEIAERRRTEDALRQSEQQARALLDGTRETLALVTSDGVVLAINETGAARIGKTADQVIGHRFEDLVPRDVAESRLAALNRAVSSGRICLDVDTREGRTYSSQYFPVIDENGEVTRAVVFAQDVTGRKRAEEELRAKERELEARARELEQMNQALTVLLELRDEEKARLQSGIVENVDRLVRPWLSRLAGTDLSPDQAAFVEAVEQSVEDLISPLAHRLSSDWAGLTSSELEVAKLIRDGKSSKQIADILNKSYSVIAFHRRNIRAKLGLKSKKQNLRSHLLILSADQ